MDDSVLDVGQDDPGIDEFARWRSVSRAPRNAGDYDDQPLTVRARSQSALPGFRIRGDRMPP